MGEEARVGEQGGSEVGEEELLTFLPACKRDAQHRTSTSEMPRKTSATTMVNTSRSVTAGATQ